MALRREKPAANQPARISSCVLASVKHYIDGCPYASKLLLVLIAANKIGISFP
jgi:hypothetical protein